MIWWDLWVLRPEQIAPGEWHPASQVTWVHHPGVLQWGQQQKGNGSPGYDRESKWTAIMKMAVHFNLVSPLEEAMRPME